MGWTDPRTWLVGEKLRAADMNAHVRDNLLFLYDAPQVAVRLTEAQEVAHATDHVIAWDEAVWGTPGMFDPGGPTAIVIQRDGLYSIVCSALWDEAPGDDSKRAIFLEVNGARRRGIQVPAVNPAELVLSAETSLADGDVLRFEVRQLSGGPLDLRPNRTVCTVRWASSWIGTI